MKATAPKNKHLKSKTVKMCKTSIWQRNWEKKYEKQRKSGRFIKEDGIC